MIPSKRKSVRDKLQAPGNLDQSPTSPTSLQASRSSEFGNTIRSTSSILGKTPSIQHKSASWKSGGPQSISYSETHPFAFLEKRPLGLREWIVVFVEICVAYSGHMIKKRKSNPEEALRQFRTKRDLDISLLNLNGWTAVGSMVAGIIGDCYLGPYGLALGSVWVNFLTNAILYVEELVRSTIFVNPYSDFVSKLTTVSFIIVKSTDFSRIIFGLENLRRRKRSTTVLFVFILLFVGDQPGQGGLLMLFATSLKLGDLTQLRMGICFSGISLLLIHSVPHYDTSRDFSYIGRKVVQCIFIYIVRLFKCPASHKHWVGTHQMKFKPVDRRAEFAAKELMILFLTILPTIGYTFFVVGKWSQGNLWEEFAIATFPSGFFHYMGALAGVQVIIYISMITTFFVLRPVLEHVGIKKKFSHQFIVGYFVGLITFWYAAGVAKMYENPGTLSGVGHVRIINSRKETVLVVTEDPELSQRNFSIEPEGTFMLTFSVQYPAMIKTKLIFNELESFNSFLEVSPKKVTAYIFSDPPELLRIPGFIPVWMGVPVANDPEKARIFVFIATRTLGDVRFLLVDKNQETDVQLFTRALSPGFFFVFEVPAGTYEASIERTHVSEMFVVQQGSVHGLIFYSDYHSERLLVDVIIEDNEASSILAAGFAAGYGVSFALAYVAFAHMVFLRSPPDLLAITFGYLSFLEKVPNWILLIGFYSWHDQVTADDLMMYAFFISFLFIVCIFVFVKYTNIYGVYIMYV
ncbi:hypothetical protein GE061_012456 [Apolygus lucorum]|uniref:Uncharacterized protein n=1 Tax=Apolygus lucorum TaxID=248454 RepID=A0A6A4JI76_APOLU|nr:hypothetical protein GE061_012456 [Apolygus lucorum]